MKKAFLFFSILCCAFSVPAQERPFARTFSTYLVHEGHYSMEMFHTSRLGHAEGSYHAMDQQLEMEVGMSHRLQGAFSIDRTQVLHSDEAKSIAAEYGVSTEWKYRLNYPGKKTGIGLFGGIGISDNKPWAESKLIIDHSYGKELVAFNIGYEWEGGDKEAVEGEHKQAPMELNLACMHHFSQVFSAGVEVANCNDLADLHWNHSVLFAGPTLHFNNEHWFLVASFLPQLSNIHRTDSYPEKKVLTSHEKGEARIIFGITF
jgi:hypothetical protein